MRKTRTEEEEETRKGKGFRVINVIDRGGWRRMRKNRRRSLTKVGKVIEEDIE